MQIWSSNAQQCAYPFEKRVQDMLKQQCKIYENEQLNLCFIDFSPFPLIFLQPRTAQSGEPVSQAPSPSFHPSRMDCYTFSLRSRLARFISKREKRDNKTNRATKSTRAAYKLEESFPSWLTWGVSPRHCRSSRPFQQHRGPHRRHR